MHVSQSPELRFDLKQQAAIQPTQLETATQILPASEGQTRSTPYKHKYTPLFCKCQHVPNTLASFNMSPIVEPGQNQLASLQEND